MSLLTSFLSVNILTLSLLFILTLVSSLGIPGALVLIVSTGALADSLYELIAIILVVFIAAIIGDIIAYELARKFSEYFSSKLKKYRLYNEGEDVSKKILKNKEFTYIFLTRWLFTGADAVLNYILGLQKFNRKKYIIAVISGELLYAIIYTLLGYFFKETWNDLTNVIQDIIIVLFLIVIAVLLIRYWMRHKRKKL